jgi:Xaa-Pro dipeptidase
MDPAAAYAAHVAHLNEHYGRAAAASGYDAIVLHAGAPALRDPFDDQHWALRPTPAFAHWIALDEPDAVIVVAPGRAPRLRRPRIDDYWHAPPPAPPAWLLAPFAVEDAAPAELTAPAPRTAVISSAPPAWPGLAGADVNPPELIAALDQVRTRKTDHERACLAEASRRAARGHRAAAEAFAAGETSELALHLRYLAASAQDELDTPYKGIVAIGPHAAVLHHTRYDVAPTTAAATSLLVDAGAMARGYGSDITRTYARGAGAAADLFRALIDRVDALQREVIRRIRPGLAYEALHDASHELLAAALVELGIGRGSAEALIARGVTRALYPHGLGHSLGIQVHDVGMRRTPPRADNPYLRNTSTIEVGQVFTIEPGCYVIDALLAPLRADDRAALLDWTAIDALRPFGGVRIEDDVCVVDGGVVDLTREALGA